MTLEEPKASTEQASGSNAVDYATITITVPVDRIGQVFGCVRHMYRNDKRLSRVSYRKQVKVDYTKRTEAVPNPNESSSESAFEPSETNTETSRSSIKEIVQEEVKKILSKNDYKKVVATPKPEPRSSYPPPVALTSQFDVCECLQFKHEYERRKEKRKEHESDLMIMSRIIYEAKFSVQAALQKPCNIFADKNNDNKVLIGKFECHTVRKRKERERLELKAKVEEENEIKKVKNLDPLTGFPKLSKLEEERKDRTHKSYVATMKTDIPSKEQIERCEKFWHDKVSKYGVGFNYEAEHSIRHYRVDNKFYNAREFSKIYDGMGWFRKNQWKKNHN